MLQNNLHSFFTFPFVAGHCETILSMNCKDLKLGSTAVSEIIQIQAYAVKQYFTITFPIYLMRIMYDNELCV